MPLYGNSYPLLAPASSGFGWVGRGIINAPADGVFTLLNAAQTSFSRIQLGGTTSAFPAIARNGTGLDFVLGDMTGYSAIRAASLRMNSGSLIADTGDGVIRLTNNAASDISRVCWGGTTSAFPSLKRSLTVLQARLADDSGFAPLQGNLRTQANAVAETPTATHTMIITDAGGTAYRVLCVV